MKGRDWIKVVVYSEVFKTKMVQKMMGLNAKTACALAEEAGMSQPTLSRWLREAGNVGDMSKKSKKSTTTKKSMKWTEMEKLRAVVEASALSDEELGVFLRREGIHAAQLNEWRKTALESFARAGRSHRKTSEESKKIKTLERELRRKDKALAEISALLILKKKANAIWGDVDDDTNGRTGK